MGLEVLVVVITVGFTPVLSANMVGIGLAPIPIGSCSKHVTLQKDFDLKSFLGVWYEERFYHKNKVVGEGDCGILDFTPGSTSDVINVRYRDILRTVSGELREEKPGARDGKLRLEFNVTDEKKGGLRKVVFKFWVMATDYECYALVHGCNKGVVLHDVAGWLLVRDFHCLDTYTFNDIAQIAEDNPNWIFSEFGKTNYTICYDEKYEELGYPLRVPNYPRLG